MKAKIIENLESNGTKTGVLVFIDRNDDGEDFVRILAWHNDGQNDLIQSNKVDFGNFGNSFLLCERFIADF